jgi:hypothetical protein
MPQSHTRSLLGDHQENHNTQESMVNQGHNAMNQDPNAQGGPDTQASVTPEHNWEKRYKDLQSWSSKQLREKDDRIKVLEQQGVPKIQVPKTQEELEAFKAQNPETFAVIQSMAANLFQQQMGAYDQKIAEMQGTLSQTTAERAMLRLKEVHPDYEQIMNTDEFHHWARMQSDEIQGWVYNNPDNAEKAIQALSLFKYNSGWGKTDSQEQPAQSGADLAVTTTNAVVEPGAVDRNHPAYQWKESEIGSLKPAEFEKWEEHITLAHREGRILFGQ